MQLPDQHIDAFIALYTKHFGVVLEREIAIKKGLELCDFVQMVSSSSLETVENRDNV